MNPIESKWKQHRALVMMIGLMLVIFYLEPGLRYASQICGEWLAGKFPAF